MRARRRVELLGRLDGGLRHDRRRVGARPRRNRGHPARTVVGHVVEARDVEAALAREPRQQALAIAPGFVGEGLDERRHEQLGFAGGDDVREGRQRLRIHERHGAADDHERVERVPAGGARLESGQAQHRQNVRVVPLERHGEGEDVEVAHRRLRFDGQERLAPPQEIRQLLLRRQEHALAHDALVGVEEAVDGLQPQIRHPDEVGVRKRQRHAQPSAVRLRDVADLAGERVERLRSRIARRPAASGPGSVGCGHSSRGPAWTPHVARRRARGAWYWRLYLREPREGAVDA